MLSPEDNELLTRVGPGTPGGALLRMYWHPISLSREINKESPTKFVRVLGEDLVIFKDKSDRFGLIADKCPHRNASLVYGRVEERGISCVYHGWLMDCDGNIIETPPERNDAIMKNVKTTAYPVQDYLGMIWAYMGPLPVPPMVNYDTLFRADGTRKWLIHNELHANWFQAMENSMDPAHLQVLHQEFIGRGKTAISSTRGFTDDVESFDFYITPYGGLMKHRVYVNGMEDAHPVLFPNILRQGASSQFRVPIDDTHTMHHRLFFYPTEDGSEPEDSFDPEITFEAPIKEDPTKSHPETKFILHSVNAQDQMAWETQGPIANRQSEHLSYSDRGVVLLRRHTKEQIERVQRGEDPIGYQRDPNHALIDTNVDEGVRQIVMSRTHLEGSSRAEIEAAGG